MLLFFVGRLFNLDLCGDDADSCTPPMMLQKLVYAYDSGSDAIEPGSESSAPMCV